MVPPPPPQIDLMLQRCFFFFISVFVPFALHSGNVAAVTWNLKLWHFYSAFIMSFMGIRTAIRHRFPSVMPSSSVWWLNATWPREHRRPTASRSSVPSAFICPVSLPRLLARNANGSTSGEAKSYLRRLCLSGAGPSWLFSLEFHAMWTGTPQALGEEWWEEGWSGGGGGWSFTKWSLRVSCSRVCAGGH